MFPRYETDYGEWVFSFTCDTTFVKQLKEPKGKMIWALFTQALGERCAAYFGCKRDTAKTTGLGFHQGFKIYLNIVVSVPQEYY